jgi:hypothetical protein
VAAINVHDLTLIFWFQCRTVVTRVLLRSGIGSSVGARCLLGRYVSSFGCGSAGNRDGTWVGFPGGSRGSDCVNRRGVWAQTSCTACFRGLDTARIREREGQVGPSCRRSSSLRTRPVRLPQTVSAPCSWMVESRAALPRSPPAVRIPC